MLLVIDPLSFVLDLFGPPVDALSIDMVIFKLPLVESSIRARQNTLAMFLPVDVIAIVARLIRERLHSFAVWEPLLPLTFVRSAVLVETDALTF